MPIQYRCVGCNHDNLLPDHRAGQLSACESCGLKFLAPAPNVAQRPPAGPPLYPVDPPRGTPPPQQRMPQPSAHAAPPQPSAPSGGGLFGMDDDEDDEGPGALFGEEEVEVGELFGGVGGQDEHSIGKSYWTTFKPSRRVFSCQEEEQ